MLDMKVKDYFIRSNENGITVDDKEPFIFTGKEAEKFNISFNFAMQKGAEWMVYQYEEQERHFNIRNIVSVLITKKD